jgi:quercetin dioxygenase-like cupin family protein
LNALESLHNFAVARRRAALAKQFDRGQCISAIWVSIASNPIAVADIDGGGRYALQQLQLRSAIIIEFNVERPQAWDHLSLRAPSFAPGIPKPMLPGISLKILQRMDGRVSGYETVIVEIEVESGTVVPCHTHPGIESTYVVEGEAGPSIDGQSDCRRLKPGEAFQVPPGVVHRVAIGDRRAKACSTLVLEKGKPLVSPVEQLPTDRFWYIAHFTPFCRAAAIPSIRRWERRYIRGFLASSACPKSTCLC